MTLLIIGGTGFFGKSILDSFARGLLLKYEISKIIILSRSGDKFQLKHPEFKILLSMENTGKKMKETMKEIN